MSIFHSSALTLRAIAPSRGRPFRSGSPASRASVPLPVASMNAFADSSRTRPSETSVTETILSPARFTASGTVS